MTEKNITPEKSLAATLKNVQNVLDTIKAFSEYIGDADKSFESSDFRKFRDATKQEETCRDGYWKYTLTTYDYVHFSTLRKYDLLKIIATRTGDVIAQDGYSVSYRMTDGKILNDEQYYSLCQIFDDADSRFGIEEIKGRAITNVKIHTYVIDNDRYEQLETIAFTLRNLIEG